MTRGKTSRRNTAEGAERDKAVRGAPGSTARTSNTDASSGDLPPAVTQKPRRQTKAALLRARLSDSGGVSLAALIEATGWQAHTLRAAISGLRKEGLTLTRRREGEDTIYAIEHGGTTATEAACPHKDTPTVTTGAPEAKVEASDSCPDATTAADATGTNA